MAVDRSVVQRRPEPARTAPVWLSQTVRQEQCSLVQNERPGGMSLFPPPSLPVSRRPCPPHRPVAAGPAGPSSLASGVMPAASIFLSSSELPLFTALYTAPRRDNVEKTVPPLQGDPRARRSAPGPLHTHLEGTQAAGAAELARHPPPVAGRCRWIADGHPLHQARSSCCQPRIGRRGSEHFAHELPSARPRFHRRPSAWWPERSEWPRCPCFSPGRGQGGKHSARQLSGEKRWREGSACLPHTHTHTAAAGRVFVRASTGGSGWGRKGPAPSQMTPSSAESHSCGEARRTRVSGS